MPEMLYYFLRAHVTEYHKLGGLKHRNLFSYSFGGQKERKTLWTVAARGDTLAVIRLELFFKVEWYLDGEVVGGGEWGRITCRS
jgi:hypothetical protein